MAGPKDTEQDWNVVVKEPPKLDLDLYIQNYKGRTRFDRLLLVGRTSLALRVDALKAAVLEAKKGRDVGRYRTACKFLRQASPEEPEAETDEKWVANMNRENAADCTRLNNQLAMYKNNLIKESIRMGLEELGNHLENSGDLTAALEMYTKMRADVSTTKHILDTGMLITRVHLQNKEWTAALGSATKLAGQVEDTGPWLCVVQGISLLGTSNYDQAASSFLSVGSNYPADAYSDIASPNDIATYGGLLSLATMNRDELQNKVLDDQNFRSFLELEPHIRRAIGMFVNSRFSSCLSILDAYKPDCFLDIYLQPHVKAIFSLIRKKCIVQYMIPFSCVTMELLQEQFGQEGESLEAELAALIRSGDLDARINSVDQVITRERTDPRVKMQTVGLDAVNNYEREALEVMRRMNIAAAELEVRGMKKGSLGLPSFQNIHDKLIDPAGLMGGQDPAASGGGGGGI